MKAKMTKIGYEKLKKQLEELIVKRELLVKEMDLARQEGDLAENSAYHQLRETVSLVDTQISELEEKLNDVEIVERANNGLIEVGSRVLVRVSGKPREFEIVGSGESDPLNGRISHESPIGSLLLGKRVGDKFQVETPLGVVEYLIVAVN